jgi:TolB-like protein
VEFAFGDHRLDVDRRELWRGAEQIALEPQVFDLLVYLVRNRDRVVSKDDLLAAVWGRGIVSESTLTSRISAVRKAVGDSGEAQGLIRTVPRKGLRFVGAVQEGQNAAARSNAAALPQSGESARPRLSIVVLPFANLSEDREQQYFADGITDDLTTDLSQIANTLVISRNTAFTYRDKPVDTKQIGRELGVRYVLEGSVQRSGGQIRVNTQLIDAETDAHLWAEAFERNARDLFALKNEITGRVKVALTFELFGAEAARTTQYPDALDYILRGRAAGLKPPTRENYRDIIGLHERALTLDPRSVEAQSWLATALAARVLDEMTDSAATDVARAEKLVGQAMAALPHSALVRRAKGFVLRAQGRPEEAIPEFETVIARNRNWVSPICSLCWCKLYAGPIEEVIPLMEQAIRLSPRDQNILNMYARIGHAHLLQSRTDEAIAWLVKARSTNPEHPSPHGWLASAYGLKGETERATTELAEARRVSLDGRYSSIASLNAVGYFGVPKIRALFESTYFAGLRKAGMPEE